MKFFNTNFLIHFLTQNFLNTKVFYHELFLTHFLKRNCFNKKNLQKNKIFKKNFVLKNRVKMHKNVLKIYI